MQLKGCLIHQHYRQIYQLLRIKMVLENLKNSVTVETNQNIVNYPWRLEKSPLRPSSIQN